MLDPASSLVILFVVCAVGLIHAAYRYPEGVLAYPVGICLTMLFWFSPQVLGLADYPLPSGSLTKVVLMASLCTAMACVGYAFGDRSRFNLPQPVASLDVERTVTFGWMVAGLGILGLLLLSRLPAHLRDMRQPEGALVVVDFLVRNLPIAFAIAMIAFMRRRTSLGTALLFVTGMFLVYRIVIVSKRSAVIEVFLAIATCFWFYKRRRVPVWTAAVIAPCMLAILAFGTYYRHATHNSKGQWANHSLDLGHRVEVFQRIVTDFSFKNEVLKAKNSYETRNAAMNIAATDIAQEYHYGTREMNKTLAILLPRQVFGNLREHIFAKTDDQAFKQFGYRPKLGTPPSGMSTAYMGFWYFGCFWFFAFGFLNRRLFQLAESGSILAQAIWPAVFLQSLLCVTHDTDRYPTAMVRILFLVVPAYLLVTSRISLFGTSPSAKAAAGG